MFAPIFVHALSLTLQPKSDLSDFGQSRRLKSGKPDFSCKRGRGRTEFADRSYAQPLSTRHASTMV
jgi:hypothetical protein